MTKLEIYNLALSTMNVEPLTEEDLESTDRHQDVATLDRWFGTALRKASREHRWPFLEVELELGDDLGGGHGYAHSYQLPDDLHSITWAEGTRYITIADCLYTDGEAEAFGLKKSIIPTDDEGNYVDYIPEDFYDLVALALAYYSAYHFAPTLKQTLAGEYQATYTGMVADLLRHGRKDVEEDYSAF